MSLTTPHQALQRTEPMNSHAHPSTATRIVGVGFLSVVFLLSAVLMLFGIGMEGMRHSLPGPGQLDPYNFECCVPAGFYGFMFLISLRRLPARAVVVGSAVAAVAAPAWLTYEFRKASNPYEFPSISAVLMLLAAFVAWRLHAGRQHHQHETTGHVVDPTDQARRNLYPSVEKLDLAPGTYAVVFLDMDMGSIMGGIPDRPVGVAPIFEEALRLASTNGDEEQVGVFNSKKELILWRYGWERFIFPEDQNSSRTP